MESYFAWLILPIQPFFNQLSGMLNSLNLVPFGFDPDYCHIEVRLLQQPVNKLAAQAIVELAG
jgi:hypothetical protein